MAHRTPSYHTPETAQLRLTCSVVYHIFPINSLVNRCLLCGAERKCGVPVQALPGAADGTTRQSIDWQSVCSRAAAQDWAGSRGMPYPPVATGMACGRLTA